MVPLPKPERQTIPANGSHRGSNKQEPWAYISPCRDSTDANNECRAGNDGTDHRDGFRQCQEEDRNECIMRMRRDKADDLGKIRRHRFVLTRSKREPFAARGSDA
jgi:hypothetical protein